MKREIGDYIQDIIESMEMAMNFVKDISFEEFVQDNKTNYAVVRALEIIGEAVKNIPEEVKEKYPEVPWKGMAGMRDKVSHEYFGVDHKIVWETIKEKIPKLKPLMDKILKDLER